MLHWLSTLMVELKECGTIMWCLLGAALIFAIIMICQIP